MKLKLKNKFRFLTSLFVLSLILTLFIGSIVSLGEKPLILKDIFVQPGDTLWSIASDENIKMDIRDYIYEIKILNDLKDSTIYPGMVLKLPQ